MSIHFKIKKIKWKCQNNKDKKKFKFIEMSFQLNIKQFKIKDIKLLFNQHKEKIKLKILKSNSNLYFKKHVNLSTYLDGSDGGDSEHSQAYYVIKAAQ